MAIEFRTGFFGFNREDVLGYVQKKDAQIKELTADFQEEIDDLSTKLAELGQAFREVSEQNTALNEENRVMREKLTVLEGKEEEIDRMSAKIGKLYLVSQSSAKSIVDKAEENARLAAEETERNLDNIEATQAQIGAITGQIVAASKNFVAELDDLNRSLASAKRKVAENTDETVRISEEFSDVYERLT